MFSPQARRIGWVALALFVLLLGLGLPRLLLPDAPEAISASPRPAPVASEAGDKPVLGLVTGLPLYRALDTQIADLARGDAAAPWQRRAIEAHYRLHPLDTLAPVPALDPDEPESDPLGELDLLAVIQPRAVSPADNVALDDWVHGGGRLLLALDPMLSGEYELPLGDPRRPNAVALIPPVVARWGLEVRYDDSQAGEASFASYPGGRLPLLLAGEIAPLEDGAGACRIAASGALARCCVGRGSVTLLADATIFEHRDLAQEAGGGGSALADLLAFAFAEEPAGDFTGKPAACAKGGSGKGGE